MAKQAGPFFFTGTIGDVIFYKLGDNYYVRMKGEPTPGTKKRMKQDPGYALLQLRQAEFKQASELVKGMYYTFPRTVRKHGLFGQLTGKAVRWLRQGKTEAAIKALVRQEVLPVKASTAKAAAIPPEEDIATTLADTKAAPEKNQKGFSRWQVSAGGQLKKEVVVMNTFINKYEQTKVYHPTPLVCCRPCTYTGSELRRRE